MKSFFDKFPIGDLTLNFKTPLDCFRHLPNNFVHIVGQSFCSEILLNYPHAEG